MRKLYNIIFSFLLIGCVQDEEFSVPPLECNDPNLSQTITAGDLYKSSSASPKLYENDDIITAYVVSSDEGGNIYKNISKTKETILRTNKMVNFLIIPVKIEV